MPRSKTSDGYRLRAGSQQIGPCPTSHTIASANLEPLDQETCELKSSNSVRSSASDPAQTSPENKFPRILLLEPKAKTWRSDIARARGSYGDMTSLTWICYTACVSDLHFHLSCFHKPVLVDLVERIISDRACVKIRKTTMVLQLLQASDKCHRRRSYALCVLSWLEK